jgi:hypothetical protein
VVQAAAEPVQPPHDERIAAAQIIQAGVELRAAADRAGADIAVDPLAAGVLELGELQREVLLASGDPRVTDPLTTVRPARDSGGATAVRAGAVRRVRVPRGPFASRHRPTLVR